MFCADSLWMPLRPDDPLTDHPQRAWICVAARLNHYVVHIAGSQSFELSRSSQLQIHLPYSENSLNKVRFEDADDTLVRLADIRR